MQDAQGSGLPGRCLTCQHALQRALAAAGRGAQVRRRYRRGARLASSWRGRSQIAAPIPDQDASPLYFTLVKRLDN